MVAKGVTMIFERNNVRVEIEENLVEALRLEGIHVMAEMLENLSEEFAPLEEMTIANIPVKVSIKFEGR